MPFDPCILRPINVLFSSQDNTSLNLRSGDSKVSKDKVLKTNQELKPWIHFDLGSVQKLKKVRFKPEVAANQQKSYFLFYSSKQPLDQSQTSVSYQSKSVNLKGTDYIELDNIEARYIKIQLNEEIPQSLALSGFQFSAACPPPPNPPEDGKCDNGGFERGNFNGWNYENAIHAEDGTILYKIPQLLPQGHFDIISLPFVDPNVPIGNPCTGSYIARIGGVGVSNSEAELLSYSFTVDNSNSNFFFRYAMVLNVAPETHSSEQQAFFQYQFFSVENGIKKKLPIGEKIIADKNNPYFLQKGEIVYKDWTCKNVDLSQYVGKNILLEFLNADCSGGLHFGYSYIDGLCTTVNDNTPNASISGASTVCSDPEYVYTGKSSSCGGNRYTWKLGKVHFKGFIQDEVTEDFYGQPSDINIFDFYQKNYRNFEFGTTYRLTLIVKSDCGERAVTKDIFINPRFIVDYKDIAVCSGYSGSIAMQGGASASCTGCTYQWSPYFKFENPTSPFATLKPQFLECEKVVKVYVTDAKGCTVVDEVKLYPLNASGLSITKDVDVSNLPKSQYCYYDLNAKINTGCLPLNAVKVVLTTEADPNYFKVGEVTSGVSGNFNFNFKIPQSLGVDLVNTSNRITLTLVPDANLVHFYGNCLSTLTTLENRFWYWGYFNLQNRFVKGFLQSNKFEDRFNSGADEPGIAFDASLAPVYDSREVTSVDVETFDAQTKLGHGFGVFWRKVEIFDRWGELLHVAEETTPPPTLNWHNRFSDSRWKMWNGKYTDSSGHLQIYEPRVYAWKINLENCSAPRVINSTRPEWAGGVTLIR